MRNGNIEQQPIGEVAKHIPDAGTALRRYGIDPTSRLALSHAAALSSAATDELLAVLEYRARHQARLRREHDLAYER